MKISIKIVFVVACVTLASCGDNANKLSGKTILPMVEEIGMKSFIAAVDPEFSYKENHFVSLNKISRLTADMRNEILDCYVLGDLTDPDGIWISSSDEVYYVSFKVGKVPERIKNYRTVKLNDRVFEVHR